jgi:phosphatidate cytidylyltransferase
LYMIGFVAFVISLRQRRNFRYQFSQLAYCHMALLIVVFTSTWLAANVFRGLIWFFVPVGLVVCNDSFAYVSGGRAKHRVPTTW